MNSSTVRSNPASPHRRLAGLLRTVEEFNTVWSLPALKKSGTPDF